MAPMSGESTIELSNGNRMPSWTTSDHVIFKRDINHLDQLFVSHFVDPKALSQLFQEDAAKTKKTQAATLIDESLYLTARETFPAVFYQSFAVQEDVLNGLWNLNDDMLRLIADFEKDLKWHSQDDSNDSINIGVHLR